MRSHRVQMAEAGIKQYSVASAVTVPTPPNLAASRVVLKLNVGGDADKGSDKREPHNYEMEFLRYNPGVTVPNAYIHESNFDVSPELLSDNGMMDESLTDADAGGSVCADEAPHIDPTYVLRSFKVLGDMECKSKGGDWPIDTSVCCYWCCSPFDGSPVGLPVDSDADRPDGYIVTGCFCSMSCAAAFNKDSRDSIDVICRRHAMLSDMHRKATGGVSALLPAPDWRSLKMFGGAMSVEEFRAFSGDGKMVLVNTPPMRCIATQMEEVDERDIGSGYNYVPLDAARIERGINEVTLRRTKKESEQKNTLDCKMRVVLHGE